MHPAEVQAALENMVILVDTREQDTPSLRRRLAAMECASERCKLDFGDYSAKTETEEGELSLAGKVAVERKMSITELCACYCGGRGRFTREFERAREAGARIYLLVEGADFEACYSGKYRSRMQPRALIASMLAWMARYDCRLLFCREETSGRLIRDILYRELKERLERGEMYEK